MPDTGVIGSEGPFNAPECDTSLDVRILVDIDLVIIINKIIGADLVINCYGSERQNRANPKATVFG
jgi:hypothetical protein